MESSLTGKWKTSFLLMCGIMALQETSLHVVAEVTFVDSRGNTHLLDGYEAPNQFMSSVELIIGEKVKDTLSYTLLYTKSKPGYFLTNVDTLSYSFLQLFHSIFVGDISFANLLFSLFTPEKGSFSNWLMTNINLPEQDVYKVVKILSEGSTIGISPIPSVLTKSIILMNTKYNYFRTACSRGDLPIIQWAIKSGLPLDEFGLEGLKSAWDGKQWEIIKFLIGSNDFPLKNITYFSKMINEYGETLLHFASETDHTEYILALLKENANINAVDIFGKSPLQRAIEAYKTTAVNTLLANGGNMNHETKSADTLLHISTRIGNYEATNFLIKEGFQIDRKNENGFTAYNVLERLGIIIVFNKLFSRCYVTGDKEAMKKLFEIRLNLNKENNCYFNAKHKDIHDEKSATFLRNLTTIAKILVKKGAQSDFKYEVKSALLFMSIDNNLSELVHFLLETKTQTHDISQGLQRAVLTDDVLTMKYLLDAGADLSIKNSEGWKPIHTAASNGNLNAVKFLLEKGDDVNSKTDKDQTVLHIAALAGEADIVFTLLKKGANINLQDKDGRQAIHAASSKGHTNIVDYLLTKGANPNARDSHKKTPLYEASLHGYYNSSKILLDNGADVNAQVEGGRSILHAAVWGGNPQVVLLLLNRGANINAKDIYNKTGLYEASYYGITDVVKVLIQRGANISISGVSGWTPLLAASRGGFTEAVKLLLSNGANVNDQTKDGQTPLYEAALHGHDGVLKLLIEKGADVNAADISGETPLQAARRKSFGKIVNILKDNGALDNS